MAWFPIRPVRAVQRTTLCVWLLVSASARSAELDVESFESQLRSAGVRSVEDAIPILPADLRTNYTLVFASRSLQGATPAAPRAILFGTTARFVLSFNGNPNQRGYDALETMQFDERTNSFHFREVRFDGPDGVTLSEDNPARCTACHGNPARPIWDTPPNWPGVYGERYRAGLSPDETTGIRAFLHQQKTSARYRYLLDADRFANRATYVADSHLLYDGGGFEPPNARLSGLLATLNARSLAAELARPLASSPHRYALLAAAGVSCGALASFFPERVRAELNAALADFERRGAAVQAGRDDAKRRRRHGSGDAYHGGVGAADPVELRFVAEQLIGVPPQRWSLALEGNTYDLAAPEGSITLEQLLFARIAAAEPELRDLRNFRSYGSDDGYCAELRKRSVVELSRYYAASSDRLPRVAERAGFAAAPSRPELVERCIQCHQGAVGPQLPFGEPVALSQRLRAPGYPRGRLLDEILYRLSPEAGVERMPRGVNPTQAQQRELEGYFIGLALQQAPGTDP